MSLHAPLERNRNPHTRVGRPAWYRVSGPSRRARFENVFYRDKTILGREMRALTLAGERVEARIDAKILVIVQGAKPWLHVQADGAFDRLRKWVEILNG